MSAFETIADKHKMSKIARSDVLKLFARNLPVPNNLFEKLSIPHLPTVSKYEYQNASFCCVDVKNQIEKILSKNSDLVIKSWSSECFWETKWDCFLSPEIQLVLNIDGAPIFKSSKISVWPIWVQIFNLPPMLRGAFCNLSLLGLWHGKAKPDFGKLLPILVYELESLIDAKLVVESLGLLKFRVRSIVADMPATACVLCMVQFNGYSSCPHCFIKGFSHNHRMLFPVKKAFKLRESVDFNACGYVADVSKAVTCGIRSSTPLNKLMSLPWDCPIDPMHQIFLGTGKVLSKLIVSLAKGSVFEAAEKVLKLVKIPFDIKHRVKSISEINYWKAYDFKLFFFHIGPLVFRNLPIARSYFESFCLLVVSVRLLSNINVEEIEICEAERLIKLFFDNFVDLYGQDSQSFNFHTMRHLCEQVRRNGPLWLFSAFCFESANHGLLSAKQGSIKKPESIVEQFVKHQAAVSNAQTNEREACLKGLTVVDDEVKLFCKNENADFFFSRFKNSGQCFASLSYSRIGNNLGDCLFQLADERFFRVETYFSCNERTFAVGRATKNANEIDFPKIQNSTGFFYELFGLEPLEIISTRIIKYKTVVSVQDATILVSVLKEGFEHN